MKLEAKRNIEGKKVRKDEIDKGTKILKRVEGLMKNTSESLLLQIDNSLG